MKPRERLVAFYDVKTICKLRGEGALPVPVSVEDALEIAHEQWKLAGSTRQNATTFTSIEDWKYDSAQREHLLLINRADSTMRDIPLLDIPTKARRMAGKTETEGIDLSAHVIIRLDKAGKQALLLITSGTSLTMAHLAKQLRALFERARPMPAHAKHFWRAHPSGQAGKFLHLSTYFEFNGHQGQVLSEILDRGRIYSIELISDAAEDLDADNSFEVTRRVLELKAVEPERGMSLAKFRRLLKASDQKVDRARVHFKEDDKGSIVARTFDAQHLEALFVRRDRIAFGEDLQPRCQKLDALVIDKMRKLPVG